MAPEPVQLNLPLPKTERELIVDYINALAAQEHIDELRWMDQYHGRSDAYLRLSRVRLGDLSRRIQRGEHLKPR